MAAPTSPTITQDGSSGQIAFGWSHSGTEDRFEVRFRIGSGTWTTALLAPKARFGASSPYSLVTGSRPDTTWNVRAIAANGTPTATVEDDFSGEIDGTWLLPVVDGQVVEAERAWMGRDTGSATRPQSRSEVLIPSRQEAVATIGALHLRAGTLEGVLYPNRHDSLSADDWLDRLGELIENQSKYDHVLYVSNRVRRKVEVYGDLSETATFHGDDTWSVMVNYRELA